MRSIKRDEQLVLVGGLGMSGAVLNVIAFTLQARNGGTLLKLSHRGIGEITDALRSGYTAGWSDLLGTRLKSCVERGTRHGLHQRRA